MIKYIFCGFVFIVFFGSCVQNDVYEFEIPKSITLNSPYNTALVHMYYLDRNSYNLDSAALIFHSKSKNNKNLAIKLKAIYDGKGLVLPFYNIPRSNDFVDSSSNRNVYYPFPNELSNIYFEKIESKWYYSKQSMLAINGLHSQIFSLPVRLFQKLFSIGKLGKLGMLTKTIMRILVFMFIIFILFHSILKILNLLVRRIANKYLSENKNTAFNIYSVSRTISLIFSISILQILMPALEFDALNTAFTIKFIRIFRVTLFIFLGFYVSRLLINYVKTLTEKTASKMDDQLVPIVFRTFQVFIIGIGLFQICEILHINITALIAGISIGSLAIALAAQDTVKNLFGSATIFIDKPFQIGDWINYDGIDGTVEEVGFRSTRIRTFENSLVSIPNGKLADGVINNYGLRIYRRYKTELSVTYDTPPELIEVFIEGVKGLVRNNKRIVNSKAEISLIGLEESSINILVYLFFNVSTWSEELALKQEFLLNIIKLANSLEVRFAFPSKTLYIEEFPEKKSLIPIYKDKNYYMNIKDSFFKKDVNQS